MAAAPARPAVGVVGGNRPEAIMPLLHVSVRHKLMADLFAIGLQPKDIADRMGMSAASVGLIARSPLFQLEVEKARVKLENSLIEDARMKLAAEAGRSVSKVVDLRDNAQDERVQLSAAQTLLDRVLPKRSENRETREVKITIGEKDVRRIDETFAEFSDVLQLDGPQPADEPVRISTIDEAVADTPESERDIERRMGHIA